MKNLTCKACGSTQFKEEKNRYICTYCNATIVKKHTIGSKRIAFIISLLLLIILGLFMAYKLLYSVKEDITILSKQKSEQTIDIPSHTEINHYNKTNPFADVILKVEKQWGGDLQQNALEEALSQYYKEEKNKAFYIALTYKGEYAFGISHGATSTRDAEKAAKNACNDAKTLKNIADECIPYAINDHVSQYLINSHKP